MHVNDVNRLHLLDLLDRPNPAKRKNLSKQIKVSKRDTLEISSAAKAMSITSKMSITNKTGGTSVNRKVDQTIDVQSYIDEAKKANQSAIENAGSEIKANNADVYLDNYHVFRKALMDKYTKLAEEAKSHSDPQNYILRKYSDKYCSWYAADLTEEERLIGYIYEKAMLNTGTIDGGGLKYHDSLFRGIGVGDEVDIARTMFNRQMVNAQISNILKDNGIELGENSQCTFSVDPYSYYISVSGIDEDMKQRIEDALNVGSNGENLYLHIKHCATQDGANSSQITKDGNLKYQAYDQVLHFTGLELNTLEEKNGTYYTKDGKDICDIVNAAINNSKEVPYTHKQQMKDWIKEMISKLAARGWNYMKDMVLEIDYSNGGLMDKNQDIQYSFSNEWLRDLLGSTKYITL